MAKSKSLSRRNMLKTGAAAFAATTTITNPLLASPKQPGETRVIFLVGDIWHNPVMQENYWRQTLRPTGWRLMFAQSAAFITPEVLKDADLFIFCRYAGGDSLGWDPSKFVEDRTTSGYFMSEEHEAAIVDNVVNRGMGIIATHCSVVQNDRQKYMALLGIKEYIPHTPVQPAHIHMLNLNHPITKGIEEFDLDDDEIFDSVPLEGVKTTHLFNTSGEEVKIDARGGWCREEGKGRIVALLPGHIPEPYQKVPYRKIMWRAAHWVLKRDIPSDDHIKGRY
ncbi:ThuA domain-containing protein [Candidatus Latescibacterota bacterium]